MGKPTSIWLPEEMLEIWQKFKKIAEREGRSAGEILTEFISNYVRVHEPGNPQWPINRFFEKSEVQVEKPSQDKPMPDYQHMTDHELLALIKRPWGISYGDRQVILGILKRRKVKLGETLSGARNLV